VCGVEAPVRIAEEDGHREGHDPDEEERHVTETSRQERDALEEERERRYGQECGDGDDEKVRQEDERLERRLAVDDLHRHDDDGERERHDGEEREVAEELSEEVLAVRDRCSAEKRPDPRPAVEGDRIRHRVEAEQAEEEGQESRRRHRERGGRVDGPPSSDREDPPARRRVGKRRRGGCEEEGEEDERRRPAEPGTQVGRGDREEARETHAADGSASPASRIRRR